MADATIYSAGVQVIAKPPAPPIEIYSAGLQVARFLEITPSGSGRRRQQTVIT